MRPATAGVARGERTRRALAEALISPARGGRPPAHGPPHRRHGPACRCGSCSTISTTSSRSSAAAVKIQEQRHWRHLRPRRRRRCRWTSASPRSSANAPGVFEAIGPGAPRRRAARRRPPPPWPPSSDARRECAPAAARGHLRARARAPGAAARPGCSSTPSRWRTSWETLGAARTAGPHRGRLPPHHGSAHPRRAVRARQQEDDHERPPHPRRPLRRAARLRLRAALRRGSQRRWDRGPSGCTTSTRDPRRRGGDDPPHARRAVVVLPLPQDDRPAHGGRVPRHRARPRRASAAPTSPADRTDYTYARHVEWMRAALFDELGLQD